MPDNDKTDAILVHLEYLRRGQDDTLAHLRSLNGRVNTAEGDIRVLKDRSDEAKHAGTKWGGAAGGFVGGLIAVLVSVFGAGK